MQEETKVLGLLLQDLTKANESSAENDWKAELNSLAQQIHNMKEDLAEYMKKRLEINSELDEKYASEIGFLKRRLERAYDVHAQKFEVTSVITYKTKKSNLSNQFLFSQLLQAKFPDVHRAVLWLKDHQHLFKGNVYKPMILEVNKCSKY